MALNPTRSEDWIKTRRWGYPGVDTLDKLRRVLAGAGYAANRSTGMVGPGQIIQFLRSPAAEPMPGALLAATVTWLRGYGYRVEDLVPRIAPRLPGYSPVSMRPEGARLAYSEDQPRDDHGRFSSGGGGEGSTPPGEVDETRVPEHYAVPEPVLDVKERGHTDWLAMNVALTETEIIRPEDKGSTLDQAQAAALVHSELDKAGFGDMPVQVSVGDELFGQVHAGSEVGGFTTRGMTEKLSPDHPLYGKDVAIIALRPDPDQLTVLHETAHVIEGSWRAMDQLPELDNGHSTGWYATYVGMLRDNGLDAAANTLSAIVYDPKAS